MVRSNYKIEWNNSLIYEQSRIECRATAENKANYIFVSIETKIQF